ncbi:MAG TPA: DUF1697 domain-containing protein [Gemmatimonadaceae bacterium]|nr:DUF1697 domain-containing protein [Gemmatimonadaceae bacterium]
MQRYITFLSGTPVVSSAADMTNLQRLFKQLGFSEVETFMRTGNVIFRTAPVGIIPPLEGQISRYLQKHLDPGIEAFIRTPDELDEIVEHEAYPGEDTTGSLFVVLLHDPLTPKVMRELRFARTEADEFRQNGRELYWLRRPTEGASSPPPALGEVLGVPATVRTFGTLKKLAERYSERLTGSVQSHR